MSRIKWIQYPVIMLSAVMALQLMSGTIFSVGTGNSVVPEDFPQTPAEAREYINKDMKELYNELNYYVQETNNGKLREDLLQKRIDSREYTFEMVYGASHGERLVHKNNMYPYSGYNLTGDSVSAEGVPWYAGWSGTKIQDFDMVKKPWLNPRVGVKNNRFNHYSDPSNNYLANSNGTFEQAILTGLNLEYGGKTYSEFIYNNMNAGYKDRVVYDFNSTPSKGGSWVDYVQVIQPPTFLSWGSGRIYINHPDGSLTYLGIPIAPFVLQVDDLSATFESFPSGAVAGDSVTVGVRINSTFDGDRTTDFAWEIKDGSGKTVPANYRGHERKAAGPITIPGNSERMLYASFIMPETSVSIKLQVNYGKSPEEVVYTNNTVSSTLKLVQPMPAVKQKYDLDYNVLSREISFPLANGNQITAVLKLPGSSRWNGNAVGALNVVNGMPGLLRNFQVNNNPAVNEAATTITRTPVITAKLQRTDFGDNPLGGEWLNPGNAYTPRAKTGTVSFSGEVNRNYIHTYESCKTVSGTDGKPMRECKTHEESGSTSAPFSPGEDSITVNTFIYNGRKDIPDKEYQDKIEGNARDSLSKRLLWTTEPYKIDTIRWMAHADESGALSNWTDVNGQYERTFTQQGIGNLVWKTGQTMADAYRQGREAARKMTNNKADYDRAVFATDRELQNADYPIKSGYYFNPAGVYNFTLETVTYKPNKDDTKDHKELVKAVIDSFRYESDLIYINNNKVPVNLLNEPLERTGNTIVRKPAALSVENAKGVNALPLILVEDRSTDSSRYSKEVEEIYHSQDRNNLEATHIFWKNILEGYSQSSTKGSNDAFLYREFVKDGQHMYKITEKTTVSIIVNPDNAPIYTDAGMSDGNYYVKAWIADVDLSSSTNAYHTLGKLVGIKPLDEIRVSVKGSMYDDLNN
ncbi:hypothetical protein PAECIP111892_02953 [Paenibacillus auburnensis]|uniref:PKD domain-containing protein n=1 Tax=Paenibacillus auburnensis TaxID=2905649 RepID=A0ABM9CC38_9BACL|nr:hypothetical protein [Paenibacillus auburnensis]CAH1207645.1 hypothetical protein PAECIP111892_02953 [Paenibacillus auburnensis]